MLSNVYIHFGLEWYIEENNTCNNFVLNHSCYNPLFNSSKLAFATGTSKECEDAAKQISDKAETHQSNDVCGIELSRDSPTLNLFGKKSWLIY
jgi:hypothetical protein